MAEDISVHITGGAELEKRLLELGDKLAKRTVRPAMQEAGEIIRKEMQVIAPRRTGLLSSAKGIVAKVTLSTKQDQGKVAVGPTKAAFYGDILETGWHSRGNPKSRRSRGQGAFHRARRFIVPAFENKWRQALDAMVNRLRTGLKEAAK